MISFRSKPFRIDFAGNRPRFDIKTQPHVISGRRCTVTYAIYQIPYVEGVDGTLELTTTAGTFVRSIIPSTAGSYNHQEIRATSDPTAMADRIYDRLCNTPAITDDYLVEVYTGTGANNHPCCFLRLTRREAVSGENHPILSYKQDGTACGGVNGLPVIHTWTFTQGRASVDRKNYIVKGHFLITRKAELRGAYLSGEVPDDEMLESPQFSIWEENGNAVIDTRLLQSYFHRMDIPAYGETLDIYPLYYNIIRYRLRAGDRYDGDNPFQTTCEEHILINGLLRREEFVRNSPDWEIAESDFQISTAAGLINWGTPAKSTVRLFHGCEYYMYVANFTSSNRTLTATIKTNQGIDDTNTFSIPPYTIVRLPVGPNALPASLNMDDDYGYSVILSGHNTLAVLQVELESKPHFGRVLLLQNHLGIAETFIIDHIVFERETSGNEVVLDGEQMVDLSDHSTRLTLRTGHHPKEEMRLLAAAFTNPDNYLLDGTLAYRINFIPGTLTVIDEGEDLQNAEVEVTIGRPVQRAIEKVGGSHIIGSEARIEDNTLFVNNIASL